MQSYMHLAKSNEKFYVKKKFVQKTLKLVKKTLNHL